MLEDDILISRACPGNPGDSSNGITCIRESARTTQVGRSIYRKCVRAIRIAIAPIINSALQLPIAGNCPKLLVALSIGTINGQIVHQESEMSSQRGLGNESAKRARDRATD